jgi:hypothetical protein
VNRSELVAALQRVGVTAGYHIDDTPPAGTLEPGGVYLMRQADGGWDVGGHERGVLTLHRRFDIEAEACDYLFLTLVSDSYWSRRIRLTPEEKVRADAFRTDFVARVRAEATARIAGHEAAEAEPVSRSALSTVRTVQVVPPAWVFRLCCQPPLGRTLHTW